MTDFGSAVLQVFGNVPVVVGHRQQGSGGFRIADFQSEPMRHVRLRAVIVRVLHLSETRNTRTGSQVLELPVVTQARGVASRAVRPQYRHPAPLPELPRGGLFQAHQNLKKIAKAKPKDATKA
jgi:hypothetical protein